MSANNRIVNIMTPPEPPNPYTKEELKIYEILERYAATRDITDDELMFIQTEGWKQNVASGSTSLLEVVDAIEKQMAREAHQEYITQPLRVNESQKGLQLIQSMSGIDSFAVALTVTLAVVLAGFVYPKLKGVIEKSSRAAFLLMLTGFGSILLILKFM